VAGKQRRASIAMLAARPAAASTLVLLGATRPEPNEPVAGAARA
jgi:hypothetical protein